MITLSRPIDDSIIFKGKQYKLNLSFGNVLETYKLFREDTLLDTKKVNFALILLVKNRIKLSPNDRIALLNLIFSDFIFFLIAKAIAMLK